MDGWDIAILAAAGYLAATALVRLMIGRRNRAVEDLSRQVKKEQRLKRAAELVAQQQQQSERETRAA